MLQDQLLWAAEHTLISRVTLLLAHGVEPDGLGFWLTGAQRRTAYQRAVLALVTRTTGPKGSHCVAVSLHSATECLKGAAHVGPRTGDRMIMGPENRSSTPPRAPTIGTRSRRPQCLRLLSFGVRQERFPESCLTAGLPHDWRPACPSATLTPATSPSPPRDQDRAPRSSIRASTTHYSVSQTCDFRPNPLKGRGDSSMGKHCPSHRQVLT